tara:strand:- start:34 stop:231 length:198 start_codon:yes stop_codon:yes gene_type:complete
MSVKKIIHIDDAILSLNSSAVFNLKAPHGADIDNADIDWLESTTPISKLNIKTEMDRLQAIEDAK